MTFVIAEMGSNHNGSLVYRFWSKVGLDDGDQCWLWRGSKTSAGYGNFRFAGRNVLAHRLAYTLRVGEIPSGLQLDHLCRVRLCVNPQHLEPVTPAENLRRGVPWRRVVSRCPQGHPYDEANTYVHGGRRFCRTCNNERSRRYREKGKRAA